MPIHPAGTYSELTLTQRVLHEVNAMSRDIEGITHGNVTFFIQDGKLVRIETLKSRKTA
jgi:hypothetical protein